MTTITLFRDLVRTSKPVASAPKVAPIARTPAAQVKPAASRFAHLNAAAGPFVSAIGDAADQVQQFYQRPAPSPEAPATALRIVKSLRATRQQFRVR